jgi:hypothetical protein
MARNGFTVLRLVFGPSDLFTYVTVIAEPGDGRKA